jgi:hypothetical protein
MATVQQAAQDLAVDARFGRMELAMERVAPRARDEFAARHKAWGSQIRIADVELSGTHKLNDREIEVLVHVTWYRQDESDLRQTTIRQHWRNINGWQLAQEERADGDTGVLGERTDRIPAMDAGMPARFPTIRLSGATPN